LQFPEHNIPENFATIGKILLLAIKSSAEECESSIFTAHKRTADTLEIYHLLIEISKLVF